MARKALLPQTHERASTGRVGKQNRAVTAPCSATSAPAAAPRPQRQQNSTVTLSCCAASAPAAARRPQQQQNSTVIALPRQLQPLHDGRRRRPHIRLPRKSKQQQSCHDVVLCHVSSSRCTTAAAVGRTSGARERHAFTSAHSRSLRHGSRSVSGASSQG